MSMIEFQVEASAFLAAQRAVLQTTKLCPPAPLKVGPVEVVIDRVEFGNNALRHDKETSYAVFFESHGDQIPREAPGYQTQIAQEVTVHVTSLNDILAHPNQPPAFIVPLTVTLIFDVDFYALDDDCYLRIGFSEVLPPGQLPALPINFDPLQSPPPIDIAQVFDTAQKGLRALLPAQVIPLGMSQLKPLFIKFLNAGVSVDEGLHRVAFRAQDGTDSYVAVAWTNFFSGHIPDRLAGKDWSLFVEAGKINEFIKLKVNQQLAENTVDDLNTYVGCHYSNAGGNAVFTLDVLGIYDLPDPLGTIERDPHLPMTISLNDPVTNTIKLLADYSEVIGVIHSFDIVEFALPALSQMVENFVQMQVDSALAGLNKQESALHCIKTSPTLVECLAQVPLRGSDYTRTALDSLLALDDGIAFAGTMKTPERTRGETSTAVKEFKWQPPKISCGGAGPELVAAFQQSPSQFPVLHADAFMLNSGSAPVYLCKWSVLNDRLDSFPPAFIRVTEAGPHNVELSLDIPVPDEKYYQEGNLYSCDLLVSTTAGTRLIRIAPPPRLTPAITDTLVAGLLSAVADCEQLVDSWFNHHRGYNPAWGPRPPDDAAVDHLWQVEISGLAPGDSAALVDSKRQELVRATAKAGMPMRLSAIPELADSMELMIMHGAGAPGIALPGALPNIRANSSDTGERTQGKRGLKVVQQLLIRLGSLPLPDECQKVFATSFQGRPCIVAVLRSGVAAYDFSRPERPMLIRSWDVPGVRGALSWQGTLLCFGENGFERMDIGSARRNTGLGCEDPSILDAVATPHALYAASRNDLAVYSGRFCRTDVITDDHVHSLTLTAGKLVAVQDEGLIVFDTKNPLCPERGPSWERAGVRSVMRPLGSDRSTLLALMENGAAHLLRIGDNEVEEEASFNKAPWSAASALLGKTLVRIGADERSLDVSRFGNNDML